MNTQLIQSIVAQLGYKDIENKECLETLEDVRNGSAQGGFSGFIYSSEILEFYISNRSLILDNLKELANDLGTDLLNMVQSFNCLKDSGITLDELGEIIYGKQYEHEMATQVIDSLCWSVLENLAFSLDA